MTSALWTGIRRGGPATLLLALVSVCGTADAQSGNSGSVEGVVRDATGAVVPSVSITVGNPATSTAYVTTTDGLGAFRFLILPVGNYQLKAERTGFALLIYKDIAVTVGAKIHLPLTLTVAPTRGHMEISGEAPLLETTRTTVSSTINSRLIENLPVNGRNFIDFVVLCPGVIRGPVLIAFGGGIPSSGGQRSLSVVLVDGSENSPMFSGPFGGARPYQFSLEAVQEFQVNVNGYSAELGHAANGLISTVTKSGSNDFHGSAFWYYRDRGLNATDLIRKNNSQPKEPLHVHQFGAFVGGPILKDRLFFFAGYDGQRRQLQNLTLLNLPPGFALSSDATIASFQQMALDYLTPRAFPYLQTNDQDVYLAKLDWHIRPTQLLTGRWNRQRFTAKNSNVLGAAASLESNGDSRTANDHVVMSLTSILSPKAVNVARFSYLRNDDPATANGVNPHAIVAEAGQTVLNVGRQIQNPQRSFVRQLEWSEILSLSLTSHALKFGGNVLLARNRWEHAPSFSGNFRLNSLESFGRSLAGVPAPAAGETFIQAFSGEGKPGTKSYPHSYEFAAFFQDEWRARSSLTLSLGLRYDVQVMARPPLRNPAAALATAGLDTSLVPSDANNFSPRMGFAWSPLRSARIVVRGGYGLFYGRLRAAVAARPHYQNGVSIQTRTFTGAAIPAYPNNLCGPPDPSEIPPSCPPPVTASDTIMLFGRDYVQPYDRHGSLGIEYQFHRDWAVSASYLLVRGSRLPRWHDVNLPVSAPSAIGLAGTTTTFAYDRFSSSRPLGGFDRIFVLESSASSSYHGLAVGLNKRFANHFQFMASYTLGQAKDDRPEALVFNPGGPSDALLLSDATNPRADYGPGVTDARHRFTLSGVWELRYGHKLPRAWRAILSGWEFSGILAVQSGLPYSGLVNFDLNNDGNSASDRTPGQQRNTYRFPPQASFDPRLTRNVQLGERLRLRVIAEAFNVFNRANVVDVRTTQYSRSTSAATCGVAGTPCLVPQPNFGTPTATSGPRVMQLALKLLF
jgi:hypothetical protein